MAVVGLISREIFPIATCGAYQVKNPNLAYPLADKF